MNIFFCLLILGITQADSTRKVVDYSSNSIIYFPKENRIVLLDSAVVKYGDVEVKADSIEYNTTTKILSAYKNVHFLTSTDKVDGTQLYYNIDTKKGLMQKARTKVENGFVDGSQMWLIKEKTLQVLDGYYTTCDHNPPHYYFFGKRSKVLLDNTAITQGVVLKIFGIPCAAAPFWFFPISKNRKSGLMPFKFGQSNTEGRYAKGIAYYLVINDYADMTFMLDVMEKKGFQPKVEGIYIVNPFAQGQILASYIHELKSKRGRYSFNAKHRSQFLFSAYLDVFLDFVSDQSYIPDYAENKAQWLKKEVYSQVSINREVRKVGKTSLSFIRRQDFERSILEYNFPNFSVNFYRIPLTANWSFTPGFSFANNQKKYDSTANYPRGQISSLRSFSGRMGISNPKTFLGAFDLPISVSYKIANDRYNDSIDIGYKQISGGTGFSSSQTIFQALNISEGINYNHSVLFKETTQTNVVYNFDFSSNITLFRLFDIGWFGIDNILHRVTPSIGFTLTPQTKKYKNWAVPRLDTTPQSANIGFNVNNTFQGKFIKSNEKRDLVTAGLSSGYDFNAKTLSALAFNSDLYLISQSNLRLTSNVSLSYPWQLQPISRARISGISINSDFNYTFSQKDTVGQEERGFSIVLNHLYTAQSDGLSPLLTQSNMVNIIMSIVPKGWKFDFSAGYNFSAQEKLTNYSLSVWKDLHCWEAIINLNRFGSAWSYDFKIRIKKIPDVGVGKGILGFMLPFK